MADAAEVSPTKAKLASLGGKVEDYQIPEETMAQVEKSTEVEPVAAEENLVVMGKRGPVETIQGVGSARKSALVSAGITTKEELLKRGGTKAGRAEIASQTEISEKFIEKWVSAADLSRVKGIGAQYAELLEAAGVSDVGTLAKQNAGSLQKQLADLNASKKLVREIPGVSQVQNWIDQAKTLPAAITS
jgi:predicted flap endonuclease-1-like 5' DNA nuclease